MQKAIGGNSGSSICTYEGRARLPPCIIVFMSCLIFWYFVSDYNINSKLIIIIITPSFKTN